tara:strand:+ start:961 stop:1077 length:117 start_codon:yes stop_codon:yes gene_type:complete
MIKLTEQEIEQRTQENKINFWLVVGGLVACVTLKVLGY